MTKIHKTKSTLVMSVIIMLHLLLPQTAYAADGTDGTEMQVLQPQQLEIQLGSNWAGVEFQLKTDAGLYPGTISVGEDGVLRLEIGGSSTYTLTFERETQMCSSHTVSTKALNALILETIRTTASYAIQNKEEFIQKVSG